MISRHDGKNRLSTNQRLRLSVNQPISDEEFFFAFAFTDSCCLMITDDACYSALIDRFFFLLQFDVVDKHFTASNLALLFMDFMRCSQTGSHRRRLDQTLIAGRDRQSQTLDCLIGCDKMHYRCIQKNVAEANDVALSFARHLETVL